MEHTHPGTVTDSNLQRHTLIGWKLIASRFIWLAVFIFTVIIVIFSINARMAQLAMELMKLSPDMRTWMESVLSISGNTYIIIKIAQDITLFLAFSAVAIIIFLNRSNDWMAMLVSTTLLAFGAALLPSLEALSMQGLFLSNAANFIRALGGIMALLVLYIFPNGRFTPTWTRYATGFWALWALAWLLFDFDPTGSGFLRDLDRFFAFTFSTGAMIEKTMGLIRQFSLAMIILIWFSTGIFSQIYRFKHISTPVERQQTKGIVFGLNIAFLGYILYTLPPFFIKSLHPGSIERLLFNLIGEPIYTLAMAGIPAIIIISLSLYRLWDVDLMINRVLVYSGLTLIIGASYIVSVLLLQYVLGLFLNINDSTIALVISTLSITLLFSPVHRRMQDFIDRRFYRERIDFRKEFTGFSRLVRTIIELPDLLHLLVERTTSLLHTDQGAVFLVGPNLDKGDVRFELEESQGLGNKDGIKLDLNATQLGQLLVGESVLMPHASTFELLVPLTALRSSEKKKNELSPYLVGVLALGSRRSGLGYSQEDRELLTGLADQAGTAIYVAQLIRERQAETRRREEAEHQLENYRNSPAGHAESLAERLTQDPKQTLNQLHILTQQAGTNPQDASLLASLPGALHSLAQNSSRSAVAHAIAGMAEGFNYFYTAQVTPELVPVGLRSLMGPLLDPVARDWDGIEAALEVYQRCHMAIEANSISQITGDQDTGANGTSLTDGFKFAHLTEAPFLHPLIKNLGEFDSIISALRAYERVDSTQDKLAYLAGAVERIRHIDRSTRNELGAADRAIAQYIAEVWLSVITGTISDLQTRARLVCQLLTRHTWQDDVISVGLTIRNEGHGAALNIRISVAPDPDYSAIDTSARIERLAFGEESQTSVRVRPHLQAGVNQFRVRFIIMYTDPRGPDQVENFADMITLLSTDGEFKFISNPYVVGTPLKTGSPLFFGRADIIDFIRENLEASHRNNLVLIGQRRTGKTSLLKQLPAHLSDEYMPVYIDGQAMGLDPGLANFFLNLATEISFAMEDRGFSITPPNLNDLASGPAGVFERDFLGKVRQTIGDRHLLLMLDEFEELESAVRRGDLEASIFGFLRHLIQHSPNLSVIFCGTHRLEELASDYWNILFNISIYKHIAFLERQEALRLIEEPVRPFGMRYDDLALDKIWRVTAGHPYFLQLLCHNLVNQHNKTQRSYVTIGDVNNALNEILAAGEAHFVYLWTESGPLEKLALTTLSRMASLTGQVTAIQVTDYLDERGVTVDRQGISQALHHLALRDVLSEVKEGDGTLGEAYHWKLGLLGMWVEKYKSLSRVVDEAEQ